MDILITDLDEDRPRFGQAGHGPGSASPTSGRGSCRSPARTYRERRGSSWGRRAKPWRFSLVSRFLTATWKFRLEPDPVRRIEEDHLHLSCQALPLGERGHDPGGLPVDQAVLPVSSVAVPLVGSVGEAGRRSPRTGPAGYGQPTGATSRRRPGAPSRGCRAGRRRTLPACGDGPRPGWAPPPCGGAWSRSGVAAPRRVGALVSPKLECWFARRCGGCSGRWAVGGSFFLAMSASLRRSVAGRARSDYPLDGILQNSVSHRRVGDLDEVPPSQPVRDLG